MAVVNELYDANSNVVVACAVLGVKFRYNTRVRDKVSMQTVLTALLFRHKQIEPQIYCQKSNRLLEQNIGS